MHSLNSKIICYRAVRTLCSHMHLQLVVWQDATTCPHILPGLTRVIDFENNHIVNAALHHILHNSITRYSRPEHACTYKYIRMYLDL